jgi:hypothetical protein
MGETSTGVESPTIATPLGETKKLASAPGTSEPLETSYSGEISQMRPVRISGSASITVRVNVGQIQRQRTIEAINAEVRRRSQG